MGTRGRPKNSGSLDTLDTGGVKVVYEGLGTGDAKVGVRFHSQGRYVSFYVSKEGLEALHEYLGEALKVLK